MYKIPSFMFALGLQASALISSAQGQTQATGDTLISWAKDDAWASQVIERNGKFYWYVAVGHASIHGKAIGVAVSDSPTGPFKDARGSALITNDMTSEGVQ